MKKNRLGSYNQDNSEDSYDSVISLDEETIEETVRSTSFDSELTRQEWVGSTDPRKRLLAWFFSKKNLWARFKTVGQLRAAQYRHTPEAKRIVEAGWSVEQMLEALERLLVNEKIKDEWTLETLSKYLTK